MYLGYDENGNIVRYGHGEERLIGGEPASFSKSLAKVVKPADPFIKPINKTARFLKDHPLLPLSLAGLMAWWFWHLVRVDSYIKRNFVDVTNGKEYLLSNKQFEEIKKYNQRIRKYYTSEQRYDMILKKIKKMFNE